MFFDIQFLSCDYYKWRYCTNLSFADIIYMQGYRLQQGQNEAVLPNNLLSPAKI
jgi:hypothetical protein